LWRGVLTPRPDGSVLTTHFGGGVKKGLFGKKGSTVTGGKSKSGS